METTTLSFLMSLDEFHSCFLWAVITGFVLAFVLGFGMGANDVSNAFGTSVGSKVLSLRNAYILASIVETAGAVLVGYNVTDTMRKSVVDLGLYNSTPSELLLGQVAILGGGSCWLILATILKAPVSTTHSIMGATLGFTLLMRGTEGIHYAKVFKIALSWVLSPLLSGAASIVLYMIVDFTVLRRRNPLKCGFRMLPIFYFFCIAFNTFAVSYQGSKILGLSDIPFYFAFSLSITAGLLAALIFYFVVAPRLVRWLQDGSEISTPSNRNDIMRLSVVSPSESGGPVNNSMVLNAFGSELSSQALSYDAGKLPSKKKMFNERAQKFHLSPKGIVSWFLPYNHRKEDHKTLRLFSSIQVFTACFAGFAHGANDVSNAIAPLTVLMSVYNDMDVQQAGQTPLYILFYGVVSICCGLRLLGHRVIKTVGQRMSEINPASGFSIEFGAAMTTLIASKLGLPISTTHCLVGSVVGVGMVKAGEGVDWSIFVGIALSWVVTLPISGALSAAIMFLLKTLFL